jgi:hypothetical protein
MEISFVVSTLEALLVISVANIKARIPQTVALG